ncbi:MAG TPA: glycosyltransferase [Actinomycetota bacterium]|jgi:hyaluronan synthase|nr:glycosyltransferase [Actinomycetota bacterium]
MDWIGSLAFLVPLGILGVIRWTSWLIRRLPAVLYRSVENDHREPLSIVVPVYQEDPQTFRYALESWLRNDVEEIILVIDHTDRTCIDIASEYPVRVIVTPVPGKRPALKTGWEATSTPLVALVDSDTIWASDVAQLVCMPFADPKVGGVATRQNVANPRTPWQHLNDMYLDYRYFDEVAAQTVRGRAISCISGRTAVYRRELLLRHADRFMNETFLGVRCMSGDDKRLTTLILEGGHLTVLQRSARVWSSFPPDALGFVKQRLRWSRNTWRSDLRALKDGWVWHHPFLAFSMIDKAVSSFTLLVSPTIMVLALIAGNELVAGLLGAWWLLSRSAKMLPHLERRPRHAVTMMPLFIVTSFVMALVKISALFTIRRQRWLTRDVEVSARTGEVERSGRNGSVPSPTSVAAALPPPPPPRAPAALPPLPPPREHPDLFAWKGKR